MRSTITGDGTAVRWTELPGVGRPLVFVHGLGAASLPHFLHVATDPALRGRAAVFVDLPGFGLSDRPPGSDYSLEGHATAVTDVISDLGVGPVDLVGHSLGGSVAIIVASRRPDHVARLVVIEPNLLAWDGTASVSIARQSEDDFVRSGFDELVAAAGPDWAATLRLADPRALYRTAVGLCLGTDPSMATSLAGIRVPSTVVWGERTPKVDVLSDLVAAGVRLAVVPGSGHVPMEDAPHALAAVLASTLPLDRSGGSD